MLWFAGAVAAGTMLAAIALGGAGPWLSAADRPQKADAIVVLGGAFERTVYAADLYAAGYADRIYLSDPRREPGHSLLERFDIIIPSEHEISKAILKKTGIPAKDIMRFQQTALSTADEATSIRNLFNRRRVTILVVTSAYHVRRARMIIGDALKDSGVTALILATPHEPYAAEWWKDQDSARHTLLEIAKIVFYLGGGRYRTAQ